MPESFYFGVTLTPFERAKDKTLFIGESSDDYAIWADNGRKYWSNSSNPFASSLKEGDIVKLTLDRVKCSLSLSINGKSFGNAFDNIDNSAKEIFFCVSMYK